MQPTDRQLSELLRNETKRLRGQNPRRLCPTVGELLRFAEGELVPEARERLADHVGDCADCAAELRALLERPLPEVPGGVQASGSRPRGADNVVPMRPRATLWIGALAALLLVALGIGLVQDRLGLFRHDVVRGLADAAVEPPPNARLETPPEILRWSDAEMPLAPARVRVLDEEGTVRLDRTVSDPVLVLDDEERAALGSGRFVWTVDTDREGERLGPFWFEVAPPQR